MKKGAVAVVMVLVLLCLAALIGGAAEEGRILEINGDLVDLSRVHPSPASLDFSTAAQEVIITQIDHSQFPVIQAYIEVVDSFGVLLCGLTEEDFCVSQDGEAVDFELTSMDTVPCPTSVCLVMDVSGSMEWRPLESAKEAATSFVRRMGPYGRAAIVTYSSCVETLQVFTSDTTLLIDAINSLSAGGRTAMFDGFWVGVDLTCPEPDVHAVIGFTDGQENNSQACWPPPDGLYEPEDWYDDCDTVTWLAKACGFPLYTVGLGRDAWPDPLICLAENTGGRYYYAPTSDQLDSIFLDIQSRLCCSYLITYTSPDTVQDCDVHQVVVCEGGELCTPCDTGYYQELCPPIIKRTPPTIALSDTCQPHDQDLVIEAWITDTVPPPVQEASLFWRITGSASAFKETTMANLHDSLYQGGIPGSALPMGTPGVDYYLRAWDGELFAWDPPENFETSPYQIEICPNYPPVIENVWYVDDTCAYLETPFPIMCEVFDTTDYVDSVHLFYRPAGETSYDHLLMSHVGGDQYLGTVPGSSVGPAGFEYYIRAVDNYGLDAFYGDSVSPHQVPLCPNEPPVIENVWYVDDTCACLETPFPIMCEVFDTTDYVDSVYLFYRPAGKTPYDHLLMSHEGGGQYLGTVPGSAVGPAGFEYYIRAVDNWGLDAHYGNEVSPHQVPLCRNEPPVITDVWYPADSCVWLGNDFPIMCEVFDTTDWVDSVYLFYRRGGEVDYQDTTMQDQGGGHYLGVVPGSFAGPTGIDYYICAWDNFGLAGYYGSAADPVHVDTCPHEPVPPVRVPFDTCVYEGMPNCIPVYLDSLPPWEVYSAQMTLFYDEAVIEAAQVTTDNSIAQMWGAPTYVVGTGEIFIDMSGTSSLENTGVLVWICFDVTGEVGDTTLLEFEDDSVSLEGSNFWAQWGIIRICPWGTTVDLDIKPQSCPNPLNTGGGGPSTLARSGVDEFDLSVVDPSIEEIDGGVLPVAILGTDGFDVTTIDPSTVELEGVSPLRWNLEDVATPVESDDTCECTTAGPDGYGDMTFKFDKQEIVNALEAEAPFVDGEVRVLTITGMTYAGMPIWGHDCVVIIHKELPSAEPLPVHVLDVNRPNPFNPETDISFTLSERTSASLTIYNVAGRKVKTMIDREMEAGTYTIRWDGRDEAGMSVASGVYLYRLKAGAFDQTMKMVLMK